MKLPNYLRLLLTISALSLFLSGCVIKPAPVSTRHFVLAPISRSEHAPANTQRLAVEVTSVKMPAYLLRDSLLVRKGAQEVDYLETALWAERLDRSFRETVQQNLSVLLALAPADVPASEIEAGRMRVAVNVEQFDVNTDGRGTLVAEWRLTSTNAANAMNMGQVHLTQLGSSPRGKPEAVAMTLSALVTEFSGQLAQSVRESSCKSQ